MKRAVALLLSVVVLFSVPSSAGASSRKTRSDPDDSKVQPDIRSVTSHLTDSTLLLRVDAWGPVRYHTLRTEYMFYLDTFGDSEFDRWVEVLRGYRHGRSGIVCVVEDLETYAVIGTRFASRPDRWSVACQFPRAWFGHIDRAVRWFVQVRNIGERRTDRAPDRGLYVWL